MALNSAPTQFAEVSGFSSVGRKGLKICDMKIADSHNDDEENLET